MAKLGRLARLQAPRGNQARWLLLHVLYLNCLTTLSPVPLLTETPMEDMYTNVWLPKKNHGLRTLPALKS